MTHIYDSRAQFSKNLIELNRISRNYDSLEISQSMTHKNESPRLSEEVSIYSFILSNAI